MLRNLQPGSASELVCLTDDEVIEGELGDQAGFLMSAGAPARGLGRRDGIGFGARGGLGHCQAYANRRREILGSHGLDASQVAVFDPVQDEAVRRQYADLAGRRLAIELQGLDPGVELLCWELVFQTGQARTPESFHGPFRSYRDVTDGGKTSDYFNLSGRSYPQAIALAHRRAR